MYPDGFGGIMAAAGSPTIVGASGFNNGGTTPVALAGGGGTTHVGNLLLAFAGRRQAIPVQPDDGGWTLLASGQALHPGNIEENGVAIWGKVETGARASVAWANGGAQPYVTKGIIEIQGASGAALLAGITFLALSDQGAGRTHDLGSFGLVGVGRKAFGIWVSGTDNDAEAINALTWTTLAYGDRDMWNQTGVGIFGGFPSVNAAQIVGAGVAIEARTDCTSGNTWPWGGCAVLLPL